MLERIAMLDSYVIRALLVALAGLFGLILSFFGVDEALFSDRAARVIDALLLVVAAGAAVYALWARATKATPPVTQMAVEHTLEKMTEQKQAQQRGFLRPAFGALLVGLVLCFSLAGVGCSGTLGAYKQAQVRPESRLEDHAFVIANHYRAIVREAADLKDSGRLPVNFVERLQEADRALKPIVVGDAEANPPRVGLRELALAFHSARTAETEAELQRAVDDAVLALADFIRAVETARGAL